MKSTEHEVKLSERKIAIVVQQLNKVLDDERINGATWNRQVLVKFIAENIYNVDNLAKLIEELKEMEQYNRELKEEK